MTLLMEGGIYDTKAYGPVMYVGVRVTPKNKEKHAFVTTRGKTKYIKHEELKYFFGDGK